MVEIYLKKEDLLSNHHDLVRLLFSEAAHYDLIYFYKTLCNKIGGGYNAVCYSFWDEYDEYEKSIYPKFEGLLIETEFDKELLLSYDELLYYMKLVAGKLDYKSDELNEYIEEFAKKNNLE